jgi:hypothetical protein
MLAHIVGWQHGLSNHLARLPWRGARTRHRADHARWGLRLLLLPPPCVSVRFSSQAPDQQALFTEQRHGCKQHALDASADYGSVMTIEVARRFAPHNLNWELIHSSVSGNTHSWAYDKDRTVYVIFGIPNDPKNKISMYAYSDIGPDVVTNIRESEHPSLVISHELSSGSGVAGLKLYPPETTDLPSIEQMLANGLKLAAQKNQQNNPQ